MFCIYMILTHSEYVLSTVQGSPVFVTQHQTFTLSYVGSPQFYNGTSESESSNSYQRPYAMVSMAKVFLIMNTLSIR